MKRWFVLRLLVIAVTLFASAGSWTSTAAEDSTSITVTLANAGTLTVGWITTDHRFLVNGNEAGVSSSSSAVAVATFKVAIVDTRADSARFGYTVSLSATTFSAPESSTPLAPGQLAIGSVTATAGSGVVPSGTGQSLAAPVMLLDVANGVAAIDTTLTITISLTILAGTMPGIYEGTLSLDVTPAME